MLNFAPTEEQEEIRNLAHTVAVEELRNQGRGAEKRGDISPELMHTLVQTGLTTPFPEAYGGSGNIEAGFVAGESAAAWLTSPCAGNWGTCRPSWKAA